MPQKIRPPSQSHKVRPPKIIPIIPTSPPPFASSISKKSKRHEGLQNSKPTESKKPVAMVNFNIFKEVRKNKTLRMQVSNISLFSCLDTAGHV